MCSFCFYPGIGFLFFLYTLNPFNLSFPFLSMLSLPLHLPFDSVTSLHTSTLHRLGVLSTFTLAILSYTCTGIPVYLLCLYTIITTLHIYISKINVLSTAWDRLAIYIFRCTLSASTLHTCLPFLYTHINMVSGLVLSILSELALCLYTVTGLPPFFITTQGQFSGILSVLCLPLQCVLYLSALREACYFYQSDTSASILDRLGFIH